MKVCIITTAFPRWPGDDRGTFILNAARALMGKGVQVRVLAIHSPGSKNFEMVDGIEVIRPSYLPEKWEILQKEGGGLPIVWKKYPLAKLALIPFLVVQTLAAARYGRDCDVVHANWTLSGVIAWASRIIHRRPVVVTVQGSDIYQASKMALARWLTRVSFSSTERIVAISRDLARETARLGVPEEKIRLIPNGINVDHFSPGDGHRENIVLFVGALIPRKGAEHLLKAFPRVAAACPDARLQIVGEGSQEAELKQLADSLGISNRVCFFGSKPQNEVSELMKRARVFALPSMEEGLGVVLLEAIASGTPCVGSRVGGIPDVIRPETGLLVPPGDPQALGAAIVQIIQDPDAWNSYSCAARQLALDVFSWEKVADQLVKVYESVTIRKER